MKNTPALRTLLSVILLSFCVSSLAVAQDTPTPPCGLGPFARTLGNDGKTLLHGIGVSPLNAVKPKNLAWELPIAAVSTALIVTHGDTYTANRFKSPTSEKHWSTISDVGIGVELGAGAIGWLAGCKKDNPTLANNAFTALSAAGYAQVLNLGIKEGFRRQYPYQPGTTGDFFSRSRAGSFTSGHATTAFAFAAAIAHRYPDRPLVKWGSYALATGLSLARLPAKKHYPSDVLIGATVGYITGTYIATHAP